MSSSSRSAAAALLVAGRSAVPAALVGAFLGLLVGAGVLLSTPPVARATVVLELLPVSPEVSLSGARVRTVSVDTDAQLLRSDPVVRAAAQAAGRSSAQARDALSVSAPQLTRVLRITFSDRSPEAAEAGAQAAGVAFLEARDRLVLQPVREALAALDRMPADPDVAAEQPSTAVTGSPVPTSADRQQAVLRARLALSGPGAVLESAVASEPRRENPEVPLASGLAVGALVGLAWGYRRAARAPARAPVRPATASRGQGRGGRGGLVVSVAKVALVAVAGAGVGLLAATRTDVRPVGQANLVLRPLPGNAYHERRGDNSVDLSTEAQLATSDAVLQRVAGSTAEVRPALRRRVRAEVRPGSEVVTVQVTARTGRRAERLAREAAQALLQVREERARVEVLDRSRQLDQLLQEGRSSFDTAFAPGADPARAVHLAERLALLEEEVASLPRVLGAGAIAATSQSRSGVAALLRVALPWGGLVAGALLGRAWVRGHRHAAQPEPAAPEPLEELVPL